MRENTSFGQRRAAEVVGFFAVFTILALVGGASKGWLIFWGLGLAWSLLRLWIRRRQTPYDVFYKPWRPE